MRNGLLAFLLFFGLFVVSGPATALDNVYTVSGVAVDVTAKTATAARSRAIVEAQDKAFSALVRRLTLSADRGALPNLNSQAITDLVQDVSVQDEKSSAVRYIATMTVNFKPDAVRRLFKAGGVPFTEVMSKPVLVIPLYQPGKNAPLTLWEDANPWRLAWLDRKESDGLVPLVVPLGDLDDMTRLTADAAANADPNALRAIADRYGAKDVLVAHAVLLSRNPPIVELYITRTGSALQEQVSVKTVAGAEGDSVQDMLLQAMDAVVELSEENWKRDNQMRYGEAGQVTILAPLNGFADLMRLRRTFAASPVISDQTIQAVKHDMVQMTLSYNGDPQQLALALEQQDLIVDRTGPVWRIRIAGVSPVPVMPSSRPPSHSPGVMDATSDGEDPMSADPINDPANDPMYAAPPPDALPQ